MKTLKKNDSVIRVSEKEVDKKLKEGFTFCPKSEFKMLKQKRKEKTE